MENLQAESSSTWQRNIIADNADTQQTVLVRPENSRSFNNNDDDKAQYKLRFAA